MSVPSRPDKHWLKVLPTKHMNNEHDRHDKQDQITIQHNLNTTLVVKPATYSLRSFFAAIEFCQGYLARK